MKIEFTVPGAPVGKGRPRFMKNGHTYTPQKTRDYEGKVVQFPAARTATCCSTWRRPAASRLRCCTA